MTLSWVILILAHTVMLTFLARAVWRLAGHQMEAARMARENREEQVRWYQESNVRLARLENRLLESEQQIDETVSSTPPATSSPRTGPTSFERVLEDDTDDPV